MNKKFKKAVMLLVAVAMIVGAGAACSSNTPQDTAVVTSAPAGPELPLTTTVEAPKPVNYEGQWSSNDAKPKMLATIAAGAIDIQFVQEDMSMTYWHGTFFPAVNATAVVSAKDQGYNKDILSGVDSKEFTLTPDTIGFEFKALGVTKQVSLTRG